MSQVNYVNITFWLMSLFVFTTGVLVNYFEKYLPVLIKQSFRYGKFAYKGKKTFANVAELPKSWFKHFYVYSSILSLATLVLAIAVLIFNVSAPQAILNILDAAGGTTRRATGSSAATLLVLVLMSIQCCRRMYETHCVSVFGKDSRINIAHYCAAFIHYTCIFIAILMEAPKFSNSLGKDASLQWTDLTFIDCVAAVLFLWANWHQYKSMVILANLRKDKQGKILTNKHKLPRGDWFEYVSSPHSLAEILVYFAITLILRSNITWVYIFLWVLINQVETALLTHWWYQEQFPDYPNNRKAILPFIV